MNKNKTPRENNTNSNRKRMAVIAAIVVIIIILLLLIGSCNRKDSAEVFIPDIDPAAGEWNGGSLTGEPVATEEPEQTIDIPGYPYIYLPAGQTTVNISLLNPEGNPCYFTFQIYLTDTQELLYTSKQVPPGQAVTQEELSRALSAGEYSAVISISTNSLTDGSPMNGANVITTLIVQ